MTDKVNLIEKSESLVYSIINKYINYFDREDLYQVAMIGLINAASHYNEGKNTKFSSFAYFYIKGEVMKYIKESNLLKVSKELVKLNSSIEKARDYLIQKTGHVPSNYDLSLFLEVDENKIEEAQMANQLLVSLDKEGDNEDIYNKYGYEEKSYKEELLDLKTELEKLDSFDKNLIYKRYHEGLSQSELSKQLGINQVKISRCEQKILTRLRTRLM